MVVSREIRSFAELAAIAQELSTQRWIFRGLHNHYDLVPSIGREAAHKSQLTNERRAYSLSDEKKALQEFTRSAKVMVPYNLETQTDWMVVAQHHGLPTRLLDWTESLLVAAFFACNDVSSKPPKNKPIIYAMPVKNPVDRIDDPFSLTEVTTYYPTPYTARVVAQKSVFTIHPNPTEKLVDPDMREFRFSDPHEAYKVKITLDSLGVNYSSIWPDVGGVAQLIGWRLKRERL